MTRPRSTTGADAVRRPEICFERSFLGWHRPALRLTAKLLAERCAAAGEIRLADAVLALPGARACRRLKELLVAEAEARRLRLLPPRITTAGALPDLLYEPAIPLADEILCRRIWSRVLRAVPEKRLHPVFALPPAADDLVGWNELAREIQRLHVELGGAGLRFADVAAHCGEPLLFDDVGRWDLLAELQQQYEAELSAIGRADPQLARLAALKDGQAKCELDVWLVGVAELPAVTRDLLGGAMSVGCKVRALVHAPPELADDFDGAGCVLRDAWLHAAVPLRDEQLTIGDGPAEQADEVLRTLAGLDGAFAADEISVAVPDEEVVPFIEQRLGGAGLPVRYAAGRPLARTGAFRLLEALAEFLDGERFDSFAALLRHPHIAGWLQHRTGRDAARPDLAAVLGDVDACIEAADSYFSQHLPAGTAGRLPGSGADRSAMLALLDVLGRAGLGPPESGPEPLLAGLRQNRPLADWAQPILDLLVETYAEGRPLSRADRAGSSVIAACEALREAAAQYHRLPAQADESCDAARAIRLLLADVRSAAVPAEPDRAAIELLGWLELHLDDAPIAVITGANEPFLPGSVQGDAFLPDSLRSRLGLPDNDTRRARDAYFLTAILASARSVRVIAGRRGAEGDPLRPSRLILAVPANELPHRVLRFLAAGVTTDQPSPAPGGDDADAAGEAATSRFALPPEPVIRAARPITRLRVSDFKLLLQDPYLFALQRLLGLEPLDDSARELDPLAFGSLAHDVLQAFGDSAEVDSADSVAIRDRLDAILGTAARRRYGFRGAGRPAPPGAVAGPLPAAAIQIEQLRARLHAFADWHAGWVAAGWRVVAVEGRIRGAPPAPPQPGLAIPFEVDGETFTISGRIDRIDHNAGTGEWAVFDYKTSERGEEPERAHRRRSTGDWLDLQLPLYRHLLTGIRTAADDRPLVPEDALDRVRLGYILLPRELERTGAAFADWGGRDLADADEYARRVIRLVRAGEFRYKSKFASRLDGAFAALLGQGHLTALAAASSDGDDDAEEAQP